MDATHSSGAEPAPNHEARVIHKRRSSELLSLEVPAEVLLGRIADRFVDQILGADGERFIERIADAIAQRFELLDPQAAAALLATTERTLRTNHVEWSLDKSVAFGASNPRYFLSQIIARAKSRVIQGSKPKPKPALAVLATS